MESQSLILICPTLGRSPRSTSLATSSSLTWPAHETHDQAGSSIVFHCPHLHIFHIFHLSSTETLRYVVLQYSKQFFVDNHLENKSNVVPRATISPSSSSIGWSPNKPNWNMLLQIQQHQPVWFGTTSLSLPSFISIRALPRSSWLQPQAASLDEESQPKEREATDYWTKNMATYGNYICNIM